MASETYTIETRGATIQVRAEKCEGTPLLLVHGGPGGTDYLFKFFARPARDAGFRPVGFIQRGNPGSPSDGPFTVGTNVDDIEALREHLGADRVAVLGHSWGGLLATAYAARYPERIERLLLICPIGVAGGWRSDFERTIRERLSPEERAQCDDLEARAKASHDPEEAARLMVQRAGITLRTYYSPKAAMGQPGLAGLTWRVNQGVHASIDDLYADPFWAMGLERLDAPATLFWGIDDPIPQRVAEHYGRAIPQAAIHLYPDCGHFPWFEIPKVFWPDLAEALARDY